MEIDDLLLPLLRFWGQDKAWRVRATVAEVLHEVRNVTLNLYITFLLARSFSVR